MYIEYAVRGYQSREKPYRCDLYVHSIPVTSATFVPAKIDGRTGKTVKPKDVVDASFQAIEAVGGLLQLWP